MIKLNPKKQNIIESKAKEIFALIKSLPEIEKNQKSLEGTKREKSTIDLTDQLQDLPIRCITISIDGQEYECKEEYKGKTYGFDKDTFPEFLKFISLFESVQDVQSRISAGFIKSKCIDLFFESYRTSNYPDDQFCNSILEMCYGAIETYEYIFPIAHLEINKFITLGDCLVFFYTSEEIDLKELEYEKSIHKRKINPYKYIRKEVLGIPFIKTQVEGEFEKGREIALERCSLAIDCLKVCCISTNIPQYEASFDIDCRTVSSDFYKYYCNPIQNRNEITIHKYRPANSYHLNEVEWEEMLKMDIGRLNWYLLNKSRFNSELCELIEESIKRYARAISTKSLHQRIVTIFTLLESLLIKNETDSIIDSITKYLPKIIFSKPEERKLAIEIIKKLYKVRSAMIHHAKEKTFDMEDLRKLQIMTVSLIMNLISRLTINKTKISILNEIDERILNA